MQARERPGRDRRTRGRSSSAARRRPATTLAKLIIQLINGIAEVVNSDAGTHRASRWRSCPTTASRWPSGSSRPRTSPSRSPPRAWRPRAPGNMKFALNGALTLGTLDGANIEIRDAVGAENFFLFGLTADEVVARKRAGYRPARGLRARTRSCARRSTSSPRASSRPRTRTSSSRWWTSLLDEDRYLVLADFAAYADAQERGGAGLRRTRRAGPSKAILNVARVGRFSSDRTIREYAQRHLGHLLGRGDALEGFTRTTPPGEQGRSYHVRRGPNAILRIAGLLRDPALLRRTEEGSLAQNRRTSRLFRKVGVSSRAELVGLAATCLRNGHGERSRGEPCGARTPQAAVVQLQS